MRFGERPRGKLRMNVGTAFGTYALVPALPEFQARYPEIELEISLTDRVVDLMDAGADLAIRLGPLTDTHLVARKLTDLTRVVSAAPAYLARHGRPETPDDLSRHNCLTIAGIAGQKEWPFEAPDGVRDVPVHGNITVNNAETLYELALLGHGHHPAVGHHRRPRDPRRTARAAADGIAPTGGAAALRRLRVLAAPRRSRSAR